MSTSLLPQLQARLKFDRGNELCRPTDLDEHNFIEGYNQGMRAEYARLAPLHQALEKVVAALERDYRRALRNIEGWRAKAMEAEKHPAVIALKRERDEARREVSRVRALLKKVCREAERALRERGIMLDSNTQPVIALPVSKETEMPRYHVTVTIPDKSKPNGIIHTLHSFGFTDQKKAEESAAKAYEETPNALVVEVFQEGVARPVWLRYQNDGAVLD